MSDPEPVDEAIASQEDTLEDYPLQPRFRPATPVRPAPPGPDAAPRDDESPETAPIRAAAPRGDVHPEASALAAAGLTGPSARQPVAAQARRLPVADEEPLTGADELRAGWQRIKAGFVDNPRGSVAEAAGVVEEATEMLVAALRARQQRIRDTWDSDGRSRDTEALRVALLGYQSLFNRIAGG